VGYRWDHAGGGAAVFGERADLGIANDDASDIAS